MNNLEETRQILTEDGWFKTGDIFQRDEQGYYFFVERQRLLIKHFGFLVIIYSFYWTYYTPPRIKMAMVVSDLE